MEFMVIRDRPSYRLSYLFMLERVRPRADLLDHYELFSGRTLYGECRSPTNPQCLMSPLHCEFDILGVMIAAANNNKVLQSPGDEELTILEKPEVSRAKKRAFIVVQESGLKGPTTLLRLAPITSRFAGTG
jgi:hypothetical protein